MERTFAEAVIQLAVKSGITDGFTVTGGGAMFLNQACHLNPDLNMHYLLHEQACAMAAEGFYKSSKKPCMTVVTSGPGVINALNGVWGQFVDSTPSLIISGQIKRETCKYFYPNLNGLRQLGDQEGPTHLLADSCCKYSCLIDDPTTGIDKVKRALKLMLDGRPGPVWIDIPLDVQNTLINEDLLSTELGSVLQSETLAIKEDKRLDKLVKTIEQHLLLSEKPLIVAGTGVFISDTKSELNQFSNNLQIPVATNWTHEVYDNYSELYAGRIGTIGNRSTNIALQESDLLLVLGSRLNIRTTGYNIKDFSRNAKIIMVDIDPAELNKPNHRIFLPICADLKSLMPKLASLNIAQRTIFSKWRDRIKFLQSNFGPTTENYLETKGRINPYLAVRQVFELASDDAVFVCGNASACIIPFQIIYLKSAQVMFSNSGSASMGYELPAAIGAAISNPGRQIVCFAGDGSILMNIQELASISHLNLNIKVIVINNGGYKSISQSHIGAFGSSFGSANGQDLPLVDLVRTSKALGIKSFRIEKQVDSVKIKKFLNFECPCLIDVIVDSAQDFQPRIKSYVDSNGNIISPSLDKMFPPIPKT